MSKSLKQPFGPHESGHTREQQGAAGPCAVLGIGGVRVFRAFDAVSRHFLHLGDLPVSESGWC